MTTKTVVGGLILLRVADQEIDDVKKSELIEKRVSLVKQITDLHNRAEAENRALTADESTQYDAWVAEVDVLKSRIDRAIQVEEANGELVRVRDRRTTATAAELVDASYEQTLDAEVKKAIRPRRPHAGRLRAFRGPTAQQDAYDSARWLMALVCRDEDSIKYCKDHGLEFRAAMGESVPSAGGVLVPDQFVAAIITLREEYGVFRANCPPFPMTSDHQVVPRWSSGITVYAIGENTEITASDAALDGVALTAKKWAALTRVASELSEDAAVSIADFLASEFAYGFALKEDQAGFIGDASSTYHGIYGVASKINDASGVTYAGSISVAATGNVSFATLDLDDFEAAIGLLPEYAAVRNPQWFISRLGWATSMLRLMGAAGGNTIGDLAAGSPRSFFGAPVVISQVLNATAGSDVSKIKALYGALPLAARMGDRRGMTMKTDSSRYLEFDQTALMATTRFDINVHSLGGTATAGPIVAVKTAAS